MYALFDLNTKETFAERKTKKQIRKFLLTFMRMDEKYNLLYDNFWNEKILEKEFHFKILHY